jgi:Ca2+-binding RTX toxin-like protein
MPAIRRALLTMFGAATVACSVLTAPVAVANPDTSTETAAPCAIGRSTMSNVMGAQHWKPLHPEKWQFPGTEVIQALRGDNPGPPRRPFEYATLLTGPQFASVQIDAEVRIDEPITRNDRDVIIIFGYQNDTQFYYTHLSQDNTIYPHNGIFVVNNADRFRFDDQWNGSIGAPPSIRDTEWHKVRVIHCVETGRILVYVDDMTTPRITGTDKDKTFGAGRIGFGSFDNFGRIRNLRIRGTDERHVCGGRTPTIMGTEGTNLLVGTPGDDVINGLGGGDIIADQGGNDIICGGGGGDIIGAGPGDDTVYAGGGNDLVSGGPGNDTLYGGPGQDFLSGGPGTNTMVQDGPER